LVVKVCGNRVVYARALATLEELRGAMPRLAFAASGGSLLARIRRLLGLPVESGQAGWREFAGLALMGVGIILLITGACLMLAPVKYEASARIRVAHDRLERGQADALERPSVQYDPYFLQTESEIMLSEPLLNSVIDSLQLKEAWGKRYKAGEKLTTPEMLTLLRKRVSVRVVPNTGLIEVHSLDDDAEEAAKIANAIAESYRRRALEQMRDQTRMGIQAFEDQWKEQVALVAEAQANVDKLRADLKISDRDPFGSSTPTSASSGETIRQLEAALVSLDSEAVKQETQLKALKELDPQVLQQAIQTVIGPDNQLANLLEELNVAEQKVLTLDRDYSAESPMVQNAKKMVEELRRKVKERVSGIMVGLQNRLESSRAAAVALRQRLDVARQADLVAAEKDRPYYEAKQRLMELRQFRTALALKISQEQTDLMLPRSSKVEIVERATVPLQPASPNRYRASALIALGVLCSGSGFVTLRRRPAL
jgi:uncharacterized protein involved in exopolysaccharide biosynthesis